MPIQDISNLIGKLSESNKEDLSVMFRPANKYKQPSNKIKKGNRLFNLDYSVHISNSITQTIAEVARVDIHDVTLSTKLNDLGISGIDLTRLLLKLEEKFKIITNNPSDYFNVTTVSDIINLFTEQKENEDEK